MQYPCCHLTFCTWLGRLNPGLIGRFTERWDLAGLDPVQCKDPPPRPWRSGTHLRLQIPKVGGSTRRVAGLSRRIFLEPPRNSGRGIRMPEERSLITAIYRSKQTGRFPSPIGQAHLSSEMEGMPRQVERPHEIPWNMPKHLHPHVW
jgi:hypothetical protein